MSSLFVAGPVLASGQASASTGAVPSFGHVFVIVGENTSLFQLNSTNAPYVMSTLMPESAWFTDYNDVARGSLADYIALTSGQYASCYYAGLPCSTYDAPAGTTGPDNMSAFESALAGGTVPEYNFITPNLCEDSHDSCNGANRITEFNSFLQREIPLIESSPASGQTG